MRVNEYFKSLTIRILIQKRFNSRKGQEFLDEENAMVDQWNLKCPRCGAVEEKAWMCWTCSKEKVPYYIDGQVNHQCPCGNSKESIEALRDPELLCSSCMQHSRASAWQPS
jgi:hypothetical protein